MKTIKIGDFLTDLKGDFLLIDARSPAEYKESHIKDAVNLFVLDDKERKEVGTLYKKSPFDAKMLGASLISKNISLYLQNELKRYTPKTKIFIYCSRGGQRSGSLGTVLSNIGFRVYKLEGGYKAYRNYILDYLDSFFYDGFVVLDGLTGSGKSELIREFENSIDLEGLANHYGSSFGDINGVQPSQKQFQNSIYHELKRVEKYSSTLIEGESKKIGKLHVPSYFYKKILKSPRIWIESPLQDRVERIVKDYQNIDEVFFEKAIKRIKPYIKSSYLKDAKDAFYAKDYRKCAEILLSKYYDKVYRHRGNYAIVIHYKSKEQTVREIKSFIENLRNTPIN
ncbi:MAG: tRNA 2-selenouridine(34) synthase MnmH [Epsilonproteobacteria bacterium]|nr:tRNA 2-selenouridine(34) synthase MnmH [Campylobacterota bacterium]